MLRRDADVKDNDGTTRVGHVRLVTVTTTTVTATRLRSRTVFKTALHWTCNIVIVRRVLHSFTVKIWHERFRGETRTMASGSAWIPSKKGHSFIKKTFHKPIECHHCMEFIWIMQQENICEGKIAQHNFELNRGVLIRNIDKSVRKREKKRENYYLYVLILYYL